MTVAGSAGPTSKRPWWRRRWVIVTASVFVIMFVIGTISGPGSNNNNNNNNKGVAAATSPSTSQSRPAASSRKISAAQKQRVSAILGRGLAHYVNTWNQGQQILGSTQYADGSAGVAAFNDPTSAASRFSAWRQSSGVEQDVATYLNAFKQADAPYTAANEPSAMGDWRDDMSQLQADITQWVTDSVAWQIRDKTDAQIASDVTTINTDVAKVTADANAIIAAS
jgi:hypothetical protein